MPRYTDNTREVETIHPEPKINATSVVRDGLEEIYPRVWRYAFALAGRRADADDLAQRAVVRAIEQAEKFQPGTHLDRWVFTITRRIWLNELRSQAVRRGNGLIPVEEIELESKQLSPETNIFAGEVFKAIGALPEAQRETLTLVYLEGYTYKEAAADLNIPIGTVMSRLAVARKALAQAFPDEGAKR